MRFFKKSCLGFGCRKKKIRVLVANPPPLPDAALAVPPPAGVVMPPPFLPLPGVLAIPPPENLSLSGPGFLQIPDFFFLFHKIFARFEFLLSSLFDFRCFSDMPPGVLGLVITIPGENPLLTSARTALILGGCEVFFDGGDPVPLAPSAEVIFLSGGRVLVENGGGIIMFPNGSTLEVPFGCEITVPRGGEIEFAN